MTWSEQGGEWLETNSERKQRISSGRALWVIRVKSTLDFTLQNVVLEKRSYVI